MQAGIIFTCGGAASGFCGTLEPCDATLMGPLNPPCNTVHRTVVEREWAGGWAGAGAEGGSGRGVSLTPPGGRGGG